MRPPMTTTKNDGVPPPHRKAQLSQKEVLAENQKSRLPHQVNTAKDELSKIRIHQIHVEEFIGRHSDLNTHTNDYMGDDGSDVVRHSDSFPINRQTNSKLKRLSSDVSDKIVTNSKVPLVSRNISSSNLNSGKTNKIPSLPNSSEVPKNLVINAFEQTLYNPQVSPAVILPLSETEPLLTNIETTVNDPNRSICLNKNSASLIFTKKDISNSNSSGRNSSSASSNPADIVHRRSSGANKCSSSSIPKQSEYSSDDSLLQHRRSLQLNYSSISRDSTNPGWSSLTTANRKQHAYSWYAPVYSALEEEIEQDSRDSSPLHNLAHTRNNSNTENEAVSLLEKNHLNIQPQLHQARIRRPGVCSLSTNGVNGGTITTVQNDNEGPHAPSLLGGPLPRRRRFENFLKSLVGRKPSKESAHTITSTNPPLLPSPEITISPTPSDHDLLRQDPGGLGDKIASSTTSLNAVQHKIWNVVPLLKREGSATSLHQEKSNSIVQYTGLRKCETVLALARHSSMVEQIKPQNRLRNSLSVINNATCSRCSSLLSLAATGSRYSLNPASSGFLMSVNGASNNNLFPKSSSNINISSTAATSERNESLTCKLCLADVTGSEVTQIGHCGCCFCTECMRTYVELEISEGAYEISCPDAQCPIQGIISLSEISTLTSAELIEKHHRYRLNREIELDKTRTWCPRAGCETVCLVGTTPTASSSSTDDKVNSITHVLCAVQCPTCRDEFCSGCKKPWHPNLSCEENNRRLIDEGQDDSIAMLFDNDLIKCCPMCAVPIEKDEGCAQMMCKRCKHVFCWYCLASLDDDFLLRHYDKGPCKNKLGHSRASVVWHRAQVIGIFAGFGILLLVASPLLLLAAPCIICCKCRICSGSTKLEDGDPDFEEAMALQR